MDDLTYDALAYLERGHSVFRPPDTTPGGQRAFLETLGLLLQLRRSGYVRFSDSRMTRTTDDIYVAIGPCDLTDAGRAALERDRRLGERPPRPHQPPWRRE